MDSSQLAFRRFGRSRRHARCSGKYTVQSTAVACVIDLLESRRLLSGETVSTVIAPLLASTTNPAANAITLNQHFTDANLPGTLATFTTNLGTITVALTDAATPATVANFLSYINSGAYSNTVFHRTAVLTSTGGGGSPSTPADIIQGGGYVVQGSKLVHIPTAPAVKDEYTTALFGDEAGTLAMAKTSSANSATSEWYFNVDSNVSSLDTPTTDSNGVTTSYTAFGKVLTGMDVVDEIAKLPTYNFSSSLNTVPVTGLTEGEAKKKFPITANNLVYTRSITSEPGTAYTVTSSNNALVIPTISNGVLSFKYASGLFGTANITITAKNLDGTSASTTFSVTVPNSATPSAGPTSLAITAPSVVAGTTATINVLSGATDSLAALNASSVAIVTQPTHGTASVNASTGLITYTPTAGYSGSDTLSYTVADTLGTATTPALVTLNVVAAPTTVTIGTANVPSLTFTQPNGVTGHLTVRGGSALITFSSAAVVTPGDATDIVSGTTISSIVITNTGSAASVTLKATGAVDLGSVTDTKAISIFDAPNATLTGDNSFGSIGRLILAGMADATLSLGSGSTTLAIPGATDTSVISTGSIASLTSTQWVNDNGGYYTLSTPQLGRLKVSGTFADVLEITSAKSALSNSTVGAASAAWTVAGSIGSATFTNPGTTFSLTANGSIGALTVVGNLNSNLSAGSIGALTVTGTTTGSAIATTASGAQIGRVRFGGAVSSSTVSTIGNISSITAPSLSASNFSAGAIGAVTVAGASTNADFTTDGTSGQLQIGRFKVGGDFNTSSISATGAVGPVTIATLSSSTFTAASISSVTVAGASNGTSITTDGKDTAGLQVGRVRIGGAFATSSISATGGVGSVSAASLTGSQVTGNTLAFVKIAGITNNGTFQANANFASGTIDLGRLVFGGAVQGTLISSAGNLGSVTAPSLTGVQIYAGVESSLSESAALPTGVGQFTSNAHINSIVLAKTGTAFSNSLISADVIGTLKLGNVNTSNNGITEGVAAHAISAVDATLVPGGVLKAGPAQLKSAAKLSAYETKQKVTLGDFVVNLL